VTNDELEALLIVDAVQLAQVADVPGAGLALAVSSRLIFDGLA
jgi:hypothetical protein